MSPRRTLLVGLLALAFACISAKAQPKTILYVANSFTNDVSVMSQDSTTGALTLLGVPVPVGGTQPRSVVVAPSVLAVYVANSGSNNITGFRLDSTTGALNAALPGSPFSAGTQPVFLAVDPSQQFLLAANSASNNVSVYSIGGNGALSPVPGSPFATGHSPKAITFDLLNDVFVANSGDNNVTEYSIDFFTGALTLKATISTGRNPDGLAFDELVVANADDNNIQSYTADSTGTYHLANTIATGLSPCNIQLAHSSAFVTDRVYLVNCGSNSVSGFTIGPGAVLTPIPGSPFAAGTNPVFGRPDLTGSFFFAANFATNNISTYRIGATGALAQVPGSPFLTGGFDSSGFDTSYLGVLPPTLKKEFVPATISLGRATKMTFTITNPNPTFLDFISFFDGLPPGLKLPSLGTSEACGGVVERNHAGGEDFIHLTGATVPANSSCTFTVDVTTNRLGSITNTTSQVVSHFVGKGNSATAILTVVAPGTHLTESAPSSATAGVPFNIVVNALDNNNNTVTNFNDPLHFASSDLNAVLPADGTLTNGVGTFLTTLKTAGAQSLTATDTTTPSITATSTITVNPALAFKYLVTGPTTATVGAPVSIGVTALDQFNNTVKTYPGTAHFSSADPAATLPADSKLTNGVGNFQVVFNTVGNQTVTGTDTANSSIFGTSNLIAVTLLKPPVINKSFGAMSIPVHGITKLTFTITNPNLFAPLTGVNFLDRLPTGVPVAFDPQVNGSCGGGAIQIRDALTSISLQGATLAADSSCTFSVDIEGIESGTWVNFVTVDSDAGIGNIASALITVGGLLPDPTISMTHTGTFAPGGSGTFTIWVSNVGSGPTNGPVTVTDSFNQGYTTTALSGPGWSCGSTSPLMCTRSDALVPGGTYSQLTLTVGVSQFIHVPNFTNTATVSGGGELNTSNDTATDTAVTVPAGSPTVPVTVTTVPVGLQISVDGGVAPSPRTFMWNVGDMHTISAPSVEASPFQLGVNYVFINWSDGGATTHNITVPSTPTTFTAMYSTP